MSRAFVLIFTLTAAAVGACARAVAPTAPEVATVAPAPSTRIEIDPTMSATDSASKVSTRDAADIEGRVLDSITVRPNDTSITREGRDLLLEEGTPILMKGRFIPEMSDGAVVGLRVFGVRPDSILAKLGFENGDRLETVNGHPIADPAAALEAYARTRTATRIETVVSRRGNRVHVVVRVEDC